MGYQVPAVVLDGVVKKCNILAEAVLDGGVLDLFEEVVVQEQDLQAAQLT